LGVGWHTSITIDSSNYPHISYYDYFNWDLKYAYLDGSGWHIETVDAEENVGRDTSIALDSSGYPHISYRAYSDESGYYLKYAYQDISGWHIESVDVGENVGCFTSISLDSSNYPHISYYDIFNCDLKYAWFGPEFGINLTSFNTSPTGDKTIVLTWSVETTAGEQIAGFNLYRRELVVGKTSLGGDVKPSLVGDSWRKINPSLITGENPYSYSDSDVESGVAYEYRLEAVLSDDSAETLGITQATAGLPTSFAIIALYPNPALDELVCLLALNNAGAVGLAVYDLSGRLILDARLELSEPGETEVVLDVSGLAGGVYTVRASCGGEEVSASVVVR